MTRCPYADHLIGAIARNDVEKVRYWIEAGASLVTLTDRATPLHHAMRYGTPEIVAELIRGGAKINARNKIKQTPLLLALSANAHEDSIRTLLNAGADVNMADDTQQTPLMEALWSMRYALTQELLDRGADPLREKCGGNNALDEAVAWERWPAARMIVAKLGDRRHGHDSLTWFERGYWAARNEDDEELLKAIHHFDPTITVRALESEIRARITECPREFVEQYAALGGPFEEAIAARRMRDSLSATPPADKRRASPSIL